MSQSVGNILKKVFATDARLDYEMILAYIMRVERSYLHAHPEYILSNDEYDQFQELLNRLLQGEPIAYITHQREFWSLDLRVTKDTLIPRPETELIVESVLALGDLNNAKLADLGTGSGAIALAIAHEKPDWTIHATDISKPALEVAKSNAERLNINNIHFKQGNWLAALPETLFDVIVSNPPYIAEGDLDLQQSVFDFEPKNALIAADNGLKDLADIIQQAVSHLKSGGYLILEHGFKQGEAVRRLFSKMGYSEIETKRDLSQLERVTIGRYFNFS